MEQTNRKSVPAEAWERNTLRHREEHTTELCFIVDHFPIMANGTTISLQHKAPHKQAAESLMAFLAKFDG